MTEIRETPFEVLVEGKKVRGAWYAAAGAGKAPVALILHGIPRAKAAPEIRRTE